MQQMIPSLEISPLSSVAALEHFSQTLGLEETVTLDYVDGTSQRELSVRIDAKLHENLHDDAVTNRDRARLGSVALPHAGDWLTVVPCPALGLQLRSPEFRVAA